MPVAAVTVMTHADQQQLIARAAIERLAVVALIEGRLDEASRLIDELRLKEPKPIVAGVCRYCSCTERQPCGIAFSPAPEMEATLVACSWADERETVCSNIACLARWDAERTQIGRPESSRILVP